MNTAALYARFSTENQRDASIDDQFRACERTAVSNGLVIAHRFSDRGISGGTSQRPEYQALVAAAREGAFHVIIAEDISRLWRNRSEYGARSAEFEDLGINLLTCVGDDTRRDGWGLVLGIKQMIAEHQRREISYRTRRGLEGRALAGAPTGGRCYGYRTATEIDPEQAAVVAEIFELAAAGESGSKIAAILRATGRPAPKGGDWAASTVIGILANPRYTGAVRWGVTTVRRSAADSARQSRQKRPSALVERIDHNLRIVSDALWEAVRGGMKNRLRSAAAVL